jgi:DNA-binding MarR family transcriptional regulator
MSGTSVAELRIAHYEVTDTLQRHFERSDEYLTVQQISEMTGLDSGAVEEALRILYKQRLIEGIQPAGYQYPTEVTGISDR